MPVVPNKGNHSTRAGPQAYSSFDHVDVNAIVAVQAKLSNSITQFIHSISLVILARRPHPNPTIMPLSSPSSLALASATSPLPPAHLNASLDTLVFHLDINKPHQTYWRHRLYPALAF